MWRSRWAAFGAAVAVSLGVGGVLVSQAAPAGDESTIVTVTPERILDTRDGTDLGLPGPFVSAVSQKLQVTGSVPTAAGAKTVVPTGATGVLLNVTAVRTSANGFIAVRPGDAIGAPTTSSLNITAGVTVPNAVQVALPTVGAGAGMIDITFDALGIAGPTTDILVDVVGYTTNTGLQEVVADLADLEHRLTAVETMTAAMPFAVADHQAGATVVSTGQTVASVSLTAPADGAVVANWAVHGEASTTNGVACSATTGTSVENPHAQLWVADGGSFDRGTLSGTRLFDVSKGQTLTVNLVCERYGGPVESTIVQNPGVTATFTPSP
jgi:hypothetical protein